MKKQRKTPIQEEILKLTLPQVQELLDNLLNVSISTATGNNHNGRAIFKKLANKKLGRQKAIYERLAVCSAFELFSIGKNLVATGRFPSKKRYDFNWSNNEQSKRVP